MDPHLFLHNVSPRYLEELYSKYKNDPEYRDDELFFIMGKDSLKELETWKNPHELAELTTILVMDRPGYSVNEENDPFAEMVHFISTPLVGISSSDIRSRIRQKKSIRFWVPEQVRSIILKRKLYVK